MAKPHREICALCHEVSRVGFWVPDDIWQAAVHPYYQNSIICLRCFTRWADEKSVEWDKKIKFYPVSFITLQEQIRGGQSPDGILVGPELLSEPISVATNLCDEGAVEGLTLQEIIDLLKENRELELRDKSELKHGDGGEITEPEPPSVEDCYESDVE